MTSKVSINSFESMVQLFKKYFLLSQKFKLQKEIK
jgi:hypothetical protein